MADMCDTREKIIEDHYILQQAEDRLEKRGLNGGKPSEERVLENAKDIDLLMYLSKESFIHSKQASQSADEAVKLHKRYPSTAYMLAKMPLFIFPFLLALLIINMRLSDPMEIVNLLSFANIETTAEAVKQSSLTFVLLLFGMSGVALANYVAKEEKN